MTKTIFIGQFVSQKESLLDIRISQAGNNYKYSFFGVSFIAVNIICLLEPLIENPIYLFTTLGL